MIVNNAPKNEAIMSNVGEIGEFRIRNSAKAFSILSSGLYANKIRAIIRELSCNAVDSHVAAGKADVPFDIHLPNHLSPHFSIRDYGTGLTHDQVTKIYTTYFESTKTESNDFIGALGLGSKSPFSYTDNFTVTAIKDGVRGVYSAFINNEGVPSIALMHSESTDQPSGVEIQFAVSDAYDYSKFVQEAKEVFTHFKLRPVITGNSEFEFVDVKYADRDIVPGVHVIEYKDRYYSNRSLAVMGNIAYPIEVPNAETVLGDLHSLLNCTLEIHFDIGELDFQASREGLSYIPQTIEAIKRKLQLLNNALYSHLVKEVDSVSGQWEKTAFLVKKFESHLWKNIVKQYITDTKFDLLETDYSINYTRMLFSEKELAKKFNIQINAFQKSIHYNGCSQLKADKKYQDKKYVVHENVWALQASPGTFFVINDTKVGAYTRATYHWRHAKDLPKVSVNSYTVYVLSPADAKKEMNTKKFFTALRGPQQFRILNASNLLKKERIVADKTIRSTANVLKMVKQSHGYRDEMVWESMGMAEEFDKTKTYYYIPLSGYESLGKATDIKHLYRSMTECGVPEISQLSIYGIRKADIEFIKTQKNWINLETHLTDVLSKLTEADISDLVLSLLDNIAFLKYNDKIISKITNKNSPYAVLLKKFEKVQTKHCNLRSMTYLLDTYAPGTSVSVMVETMKMESATVRQRYPLISTMREYDRDSSVDAVVEYINLIDKEKGI